MKWQVLTTANAGLWNATLARLPRTDVYFTPEYHQVYEINGDGHAHLFIFEDAGQLLIHPFLVRPIRQVGGQPLSEDLYDIESVYGYSGPLATSTQPAFLARAWSSFGEWCQSRRIIAEFVRFHPLLGTQAFVDDQYLTTADRETVTINLSQSLPDLWDTYPSVQRNMVRKALKLGLACQEFSPEEGLERFVKLYWQNMDRAQAQAYYFFPMDYFENLFRLLKDGVRLFGVTFEGEMIAAALFFVRDRYLHYHLAGSNNDHRDKAAINLLLHHVAQWGHDHGCQILHLGGGRTPAPGDSLFKFKASISHGRAAFYTGRRIHDPVFYEKLCALRMSQKELTERPAYFLLYRMP